MITRNAVDEDSLAEVVTRITGVLRPWRIILFGSRARGSASDDSDYDFYVEVDATATPPFATRTIIPARVGKA